MTEKKFTYLHTTTKSITSGSDKKKKQRNNEMFYLYISVYFDNNNVCIM